MKYSDICRIRQLTPAHFNGMTFQHVRTASHVFTTQYPLGVNKPELADGHLERIYKIKPVGRAEGGHLFRTGYAPRVIDFVTSVYINDSCLGLDADAAMLEAQLLYEFLRGDVESSGCSEANPDPRVRIGAGFWESVSGSTVGSHSGIKLGDVTDTIASFDPGGTIPKDEERRPPHVPSLTTVHWLSSYYVLEPDSFTYSKPKFRDDQLVEFSFGMRQIPRNTILT